MASSENKSDYNGVSIQETTTGFPSFFTPNGDNINDHWKAKDSISSQIEVIYIFDRYGKLLKELKNEEGWDGKINKEPVPSDDYWFRAILNDNTEITGHFSLIRK